MENHYIKDHIGVFDGFYSPDFCQDVIDFFKYRNELQYSINRDNPLQQDESISLMHEQDFVVGKQIEQDEFNVLEAKQLIQFFSKIFWEKCYPIYLKNYPHNQKMSNFTFNTFKVQKTLPGQGYHVFHFENANNLTSRRVMFFILYLNSINDGGETEFLYQSQRIKPLTGRLVLAPASYTHPHRGNPPLAGEKYIFTSWLEYTSLAEIE